MLFSIFINFDIWHLINKIVALATVVFATIIPKTSTKVKEKRRILYKNKEKIAPADKAGAKIYLVRFFIQL